MISVESVDETPENQAAVESESQIKYWGDTYAVIGTPNKLVVLYLFTGIASSTSCNRDR